MEAQGGGVAVGLVRTNAAGSYLFVDVRIDPDARYEDMSEFVADLDRPSDAFAPAPLCPLPNATRCCSGKSSPSCCS